MGRRSGILSIRPTHSDFAFIARPVSETEESCARPPQTPPRPGRFTRLTNAFSKKVENHALSVALFAMYYNFVRIHKTLRVTPAMAAGMTEKLWEIDDVVKVLEDWEIQK
jgi:hypothetical protein